MKQVRKHGSRNWLQKGNNFFFQSFTILYIASLVTLWCFWFVFLLLCVKTFTSVSLEEVAELTKCSAAIWWKKTAFPLYSRMEVRRKYFVLYTMALPDLNFAWHEDLQLNLTTQYKSQSYLLIVLFWSSNIYNISISWEWINSIVYVEYY